MCKKTNLTFILLILGEMSFGAVEGWNRKELRHQVGLLR